MTDAQLAPAHEMEAARARFDNGFLGLVGVEFLEWGDGHVVLGLAVDDRHLNMAGVIHGGVLATLLDVAGTCAGNYSAVTRNARRSLTLTLTTTFTGQVGRGYIRAIGKRRAGGRRIYNSTMEVVDDKGQLLAMGEGTFRLRGESPPPA